MKGNILKISVLILIWGVLLPNQKTEATGTGAWVLSRQKSGIQLYERSTPGLSIKEIKGSIVLKTPIEVVATVLRDLNGYPAWMKGCKNISVLRKFDANNMIIYYVQKMPWPLRTRGVVLQVKTQIIQNPIAFIVQMTSMAAKHFSLPQKHVIMKSMKGKWQVTFISRNSTRIVYQLLTDLI